MATMKVMLILTVLFVCMRAQGYENSDRCPQKYFDCNEGRRISCIRVQQWCDGHRDCPNGYDENYCYVSNITNPNACPEIMKLSYCKTEGCYPQKGRCDGYQSCKDGFDEERCDYSPSNRRNIDTRPVVATDFLVSGPDYDPRYKEDSTSYSEEKEKALNWLLKERHDYSWGDDIERAVVSLSLSDDDLKDLLPPAEKMLMFKSLHLRISLELRNFERLPLSQRALLINALIASCGDPRNFYGFNLVSDLRGSVVKAHRKYSFMPPIVYLSLCLTNSTVSDDIEMMKFEVAKLKDSSKNDLTALFLLTTVCMERKELEKRYEGILNNIKRFLVNKLIESEVDNIYELALVTQALNAAEVNPETWERNKKMASILAHQDEEGSFRDKLATYYVMPLLSAKTFLSIGEHCENSKVEGSTSETARNTKGMINVNYTLNFGPQKVSQTMFLTVLNDSTIYDVMILAGKKSNSFRFSLDDKKKSAPLVYSIGGVPNDAERGFFWNVAVTGRDPHYRTEIIHVVTNIKSHVLKNEDAITFIYNASL